ncbi:MAG: DUF2207 domain-containing protein, partial [Methanobacteriota archaeon]
MVPRGAGAVVVSILLLALLSLFAVASPPVRAQEKVYHLASNAVTLDLDANGSIRIAERLTFSFDLGTFSFAYRDIPWRGFDDILAVSVEDGAGTPESFAFWFAPEATGEWHIRWSFPPAAAPAVRTFVVRYTVTNALLQPTATLNRLDWQAVGTGWSVFTDNLTVEVILPLAVNASQLAY